MKSIIQNIFKNSFVRNVMILASSTAMAQLVGFLLLPIVTRLYGPQAYGLMGSFIAVTEILIPIAALTLPIAIVLPKKNTEASSVVVLSLKVLGIVVLVIGIIIVIFHDVITVLLQAESISSYLLLIPIAVFLTGLFQIFSQWMIRTSQYKIIARTTLYQPIVAYGGMISIGAFYPHASILIVFTVLKRGFSALHMYLIMKYSSKATKFELTKTAMTSKETLAKYKDFPLFRAPEALISSFSYNIPIILLTSLYSPVAAGFYAIGRTALGIPSQLIGKAVGNVFYPRISNASHNKESLTSLIKKSTLFLVVIGILPFGTVFIVGPELFSFVFGADWYTAGKYAQWIAIMSYLMFISRPAVHTLPVINAQFFHLLFTIIMTIIRIIALYIGLIVFEDDILAVALFSISSSILYFVLIFITIIKSKKFMKVNY